MKNLSMFSEYVQAALALAEYEIIDNDEYCATVPGLRGIIATGKTIEECRKDLIEVIEEWIALGEASAEDAHPADGQPGHRGPD